MAGASHPHAVNVTRVRKEWVHCPPQAVGAHSERPSTSAPCNRAWTIGTGNSGPDP